MLKKYSQSSNVATKAKWSRMCANRGWVASTKYLQVGFSNWYIQKDELGNYEIVAQTTYHAESTLDEMYKTNFKFWRIKK